MDRETEAPVEELEAEDEPGDELGEGLGMQGGTRYCPTNRDCD